jgi:hypothetical protein
MSYVLIVSTKHSNLSFDAQMMDDVACKPQAPVSYLSVADILHFYEEASNGIAIRTFAVIRHLHS